MKRWRGRIMLLVVALLIAAGLVYAFWPQPVAVELAAVVRGPLEVSVEDDGQTRVRERFVIAAPLSGRLRRIALKAGDPVQAGQTVLAVIEPEAAAPLDVRAGGQAEARVAAATAAQAQAQANVRRAEAALELAQSDYERLQELQERGAAAPREVNDARLVTQVRQRELEAVQHAQDVARFELVQARSALLYTHPEQANGPREALFEIRSPCDGQVLRVVQESARFVAAGTELMEVGDPRDLEVRVDVLSSDAVKIRPGQDVWLENWGGHGPLRGVVRVVEPFAFTKVSALGVEEQRVYVIADIIPQPPVAPEPSEPRPPIGDGYRVDARFVIWREQDALKAPTSALFRSAGQWSVFVERDGRAERRIIQVGQQTAQEAQVLEGLREGERVVAYPSDQVRDRRRIVAAAP